MAVEYRLIDIASLRTPRMQASAIRDFGDHLSWMVASDMWVVNPATGEPLSHEGKTLEEVLEAWLATRPHALAPVELVDSSGDCWREGNITKQGQRLRELEAFTGSPKAALVMLTHFTAGQHEQRMGSHRDVNAAM